MNAHQHQHPAPKVVEITSKATSIRGQRKATMPYLRKQMLDAFDHTPDLESVRRRFEFTSKIDVLEALFAQCRAEQRQEQVRRRNGWAA